MDVQNARYMQRCMHTYNYCVSFALFRGLKIWSSPDLHKEKIGNWATQMLQQHTVYSKGPLLLEPKTDGSQMLLLLLYFSTSLSFWRYTSYRDKSRRQKNCNNRETEYGNREHSSKCRHVSLSFCVQKYPKLTYFCKSRVHG